MRVDVAGFRQCQQRCLLVEREGALQDRDEPRRHHLKIAAKPAVHQQVDVQPGGVPDRRVADRELRRDCEDASGRPAIGMKLAYGRPVAGRVDHHRGKHHRNGRRCQQYPPEQLDLVRQHAGGDCPHIPDHAALRVEIGGGDEQAAPLGLLLRDARYKFRCHLTCDQFRKRCGGGDTGRSRYRKWEAGMEDVPCGYAGVKPGDRCIAFLAQKGKGSDQCPGADPGDNAELRTRAALRPAVEHTGAIGTLVSTTRKGQHRYRLPGRHIGSHPLRGIRQIRPETDVRRTGNSGRGTLRPGERHALHRGTSTDKRHCGYRNGAEDLSGHRMAPLAVVASVSRR